MRKLLIISMILISGLVFLGQLFYVQIVDDTYALRSLDNAVEKKYIYPQRGYIFDRNGNLLVTNQPAYYVMAIPRKVEEFDTTALANLLDLKKEKLIKRLDQAKIYSPRLPSVIVPQIKKGSYAYIQEKMWKFDGFYIQERSIRDYKVDAAANVFGYLSEVNKAESSNKEGYQAGDLIGRSGIEKKYEELLRGKKGVKYIQKDRFNRKIGMYKNGKYNRKPEPGKDITLTIDAELQKYGEKLMQGKRGAIVAIQPQSGEVLSLVTSPSYDPSMLVGRKRSENFTKLWYDTIAKPLYDRALLSVYPPGSTFKVVNGLIALEEQVIDTTTTIACHQGFYYGASAHMACHSHRSPLKIEAAIANSCNSFFGKTYRWLIEKFDTPQEGVMAWRKHLRSFGFGHYLGYDLPVGRKGNIPTAEYYNSIYNYPTYHWAATYILSNGIGQGEVTVTPIQLANMMAAIANRGWFYTPHFLKKIEGAPIEMKKYTKKNYTSVSPKYFKPVIEGMHQTYKYGTARFLRVPGIEICGKTGTAENYAYIDGERVQLTDHSVFVAFAPKDNPKIAISVFVEHGSWGSKYAGRIASLMIEKHLKDTISLKGMEDWILTHDLLKEYKTKPEVDEPDKTEE